MPADLFTQARTWDLTQEVYGYLHGTAPTVAAFAKIAAGTDFALAEVQGGHDIVSHTISFTEDLNGHPLMDDVGGFDPDALSALVAQVEARVQSAPAIPGSDIRLMTPSLLTPGVVNPALWADASVALRAPEARVVVIQAALQSMNTNLVPQGRLEVVPKSLGVLTQGSHFEYGATSTCRYEIRARTKDGTGSGWAGWTGEDWSKVDWAGLSAHAADLALRSRNPVAVEPGRYTVVLTAEAMGDLLNLLLDPQSGVFSGDATNSGHMAFSGNNLGTKLGQRVFDERITISADPMDPEGGFLPFTYADGLVQYGPVTWIEQGVLKTVSYGMEQSAAEHGLHAVVNSGAGRLHGGSTTLEDMIAGTARGILVTRFSETSLDSAETLAFSGFTRDGTFLIEYGQITRSIKNMRFADSLFAVFNQLEALGPAKRVYADVPLVACCAAMHDFTFTSLTEAI